MCRHHRSPNGNLLWPLSLRRRRRKKSCPPARRVAFWKRNAARNVDASNNPRGRTVVITAAPGEREFTRPVPRIGDAVILERVMNQERCVGIAGALAVAPSSI